MRVNENINSTTNEFWEFQENMTSKDNFDSSEKANLGRCSFCGSQLTLVGCTECGGLGDWDNM